MKIGGGYRLRDTGLHQWRTLAGDLRLDTDALIGRIRELAVELPDNLARLRRTTASEGLDYLLMARLSAALLERVGRRREALDMGTAAGASGQ